MLIQELLEGVDDLGSGFALANVASFPNSAPKIAGTSKASEPSDESTGDKTGGRVDRFDRLAEASRAAETELLLNALEANRWNRRQAAASLNLEYKAFLYKLQKYGIVESKVKRREISA